VRAALPLLAHRSRSGVWRRLDGLGRHWKRGRGPLHRPDPHDRAKLGYRAARQEQVARASGRQVLLDQGESTYSRQPTLGFG